MLYLFNPGVFFISNAVLAANLPVKDVQRAILEHLTGDWGGDSGGVEDHTSLQNLCLVNYHELTTYSSARPVHLPNGPNVELQIITDAARTSTFIRLCEESESTEMVNLPPELMPSDRQPLSVSLRTWQRWLEAHSEALQKGADQQELL